MRNHALALLVHLRVRLLWIARDPAAVTVLVLSAAATLLYWPAPSTPAYGVAEGGIGRIAWLLWLSLWPALPMVYAAGPSTGSGEAAFSSRGLPALPVGLRTRALAEVVITFLFVLIVRVSLGHALGLGTAPELLRSTLLGALVMLPTTIAWAVPAASINLYMVRPLVPALLLLVAAEAGVLAHPLTLLVTCAALAALPLLTATWEPRAPRPRRAEAPPSSRWRPARPPQAQLARDTWALPARRFGPWVASATVVLVAVFALERTIDVSPIAVVIIAEIPLGLLLMAALRPHDSPLIAAGLVGRHGARTGDYLRAWSVLPVRTVSVLRHIWLYALVLTATAYSSAITLIVVYAWTRTGNFSLVGGQVARMAPLIGPFAAVIPLLPAAVVAVAVGHRLHTALSGGALLLILQGHVVLLAILSPLFPRGSPAPLLIDASVAGVLALVGGIPPLIHLLRPRAAP